MEGRVHEPRVDLGVFRDGVVTQERRDLLAVDGQLQVIEWTEVVRVRKRIEAGIFGVAEIVDDGIGGGAAAKREQRAVGIQSERARGQNAAGRGAVTGEHLVHCCGGRAIGAPVHAAVGHGARAHGRQQWAARYGAELAIAGEHGVALVEAECQYGVAPLTGKIAAHHRFDQRGAAVALLGDIVLRGDLDAFEVRASAACSRRRRWRPSRTSTTSRR